MVLFPILTLAAYGSYALCCRVGRTLMWCWLGEYGGGVAWSVVQGGWVDFETGAAELEGAAGGCTVSAVEESCNF